ncbi:MAG: ROK family transcriptional regulator [Propionicimonas sp.]
MKFSQISAHPGGSPSSLRRLNLQAVLRVLHGGGGYTITELAHHAQVSRPTAKQAVDDLVLSGWIGPTRSRPDEVSIGRPAQRFEFRPDAGLVLGADVGAYKVVAMVADLSGTVVARARRRADPSQSAAERLGALEAAVEEVLGQVDGRLVSHAVVASLGTVDDSGTIVYSTALADWLGANPSAWLAERHPDMVVHAADDMTMSAYAERWLGNAQGVDDVFYLHLGRRAGAAALIGGRPHLGFHNAAPQVGLWRATPWRDDYTSLLQMGDQGDSGAHALFSAAAAGDPDALARVDTYATEIVAGAIPFIIAIDPELVVVGGGVSGAGEAIVGPIRERILTETPFAPQVRASALRDEAVTLGAVRFALDAAEDQLFSTLSVPSRDA